MAGENVITSKDLPTVTDSLGNFVKKVANKIDLDNIDDIHIVDEMPSPHTRSKAFNDMVKKVSKALYIAGSPGVRTSRGMLYHISVL